MALANTKINDEISWFNGQLADLKNTFVTWIKEEGHEIDVSEESITNNEGLSGPYSTFKYNLVIDKNLKLCIKPYGIWIIAAKGRVDISGPAGYEKLIYLYKDGPATTTEIEMANSSKKTTLLDFDNIDEEGWYWYDNSTIRKMAKLSKDVFKYIIGRLQ